MFSTPSFDAPTVFTFTFLSTVNEIRAHTGHVSLRSCARPRVRCVYMILDCATRGPVLYAGLEADYRIGTHIIHANAKCYARVETI